MSLFVFRILSLFLSCILQRVGNRPRVTFNDLSCNEVCREIQERREDKRFISLRRIFLLAFVPSGISKKKKKRERAYACARNIGYSFYSFNETWKLNKLKGEAKSRGEKWPCVCVCARAIFYLFVFNYLPWNCNWYLSYYCLNNIKKRKGKKIEQHGTNESKNIFIFSMLQHGCICLFNPALKRKRFLSIV